MILKRFSITVGCLATLGVALAGAMTPEEARQLFNSGEYDQAVETLTATATREPKNGAMNQMAGIALFNLGDFDRARHFLKLGQNESNLYLAQIEMQAYNFDLAEEYLDRYEDGFRKNRRAPRPEREEATDLRQQIDKARAMMDRVERIEIIDSLDVDRETFFEAFRLAPSSGALISPDFLPHGFEAADPTVVYVTEKGDNAYWSMPDDEGNFRIVTSSLLADNSWERPTMFGLQLNEGGEANYPFMMSDGVTLYFANTGENSIGGYDIFISRRDGSDFLQPQNVGMPYNSFANDYMMAIDEETGVGWWATDRNAAPDRLTIYMFKPSELRINYPVDHPDLASLARVNSYRDTWPEGADYTPLLNRVKAIGDRRGNTDQPSLSIAVPGRGVYTSLSDFRSAEARGLASEYLKLTARLSTDIKRLAALRRSFGQGKTTLAPDILGLEADVEQLRDEIKQTRNAIISAETSR